MIDRSTLLAHGVTAGLLPIVGNEPSTPVSVAIVDALLDEIVALLIRSSRQLA